MDQEATLLFLTSKLKTSMLSPIQGVAHQAPVLRENKAAAFQAVIACFQTRQNLEIHREAVEAAIRASRVDQSNVQLVARHAQARYRELLKEFPKDL